MRKAFSNLCTSPSGVLFENSLLQVGVKHEYVGAQGRISVFFGNLSKTPLSHFRAIVDDVDHLKIQKQGTQGLLDDGQHDDGFRKSKLNSKMAAGCNIIANGDGGSLM